MAAKFFTGLPLDGPDPECVRGLGAQALQAVPAAGVPKPSADHSRGQRRRPIPVTIRSSRGPAAPACDVNPLAGFDPAAC